MRNLLQPMNYPLSEYENWLAMKEYWDDYSHEWTESSIEKKLVRLAGFVKMGGDLNTVLSDYAEDRDATCRIRIQYCVFRYIERLISGDYFKFGEPIIDRIKRLDKEELVKLLTAELLRSVKETRDYDANGNRITYWIVSDEYINNDENLDAIEREHWKNFPNESFSYYLDKSKRWDGGDDSSFW